MKKTIALLLAMLMLLSAAAFAEEAAPAHSALVAELSNISLQFTSGEEAQSIDLTGLTVAGGLNAEDGLDLILEADTDETLAMAVGQVTKDTFNVAVQGLDKVYAADISQYTGNINFDEMVAGVRSMLPGLMKMELPMVPAINIPKLDLSVLPMILPASNGDESSFEVPWETLSALADQLIQNADAVTSKVPQLAQVIDLLNMLKENGLGLALKGKVEDAGDVQTTTVDLYVVQGEEVSPDALATLTFETMENNIVLTLSMAGEGGATTLMEIKVVSDPAIPEVDFTMDIMGGMASLAISEYPEDGMQRLAMDLQAQGTENVSLELGYGKQDDMDAVLCNLAANTSAANVAFSLNAATALVDDETRAGSLAVAMTAPDGSHIGATADLAIVLTDLDMSTFEMPAETVDISELQNADLNTALQPLMEYLSGLAPEEAA